MTTRTCALLPVSDETYREIKALLLAASYYDHGINALDKEKR